MNTLIYNSNPHNILHVVFASLYPTDLRDYNGNAATLFFCAGISRGSRDKLLHLISNILRFGWKSLT